jgi:hypothetical protein
VDRACIKNKKKKNQKVWEHSSSGRLLAQGTAKKTKKKLLEPKPCHSMTVALITETAPK